MRVPQGGPGRRDQRLPVKRASVLQVTRNTTPMYRTPEIVDLYSNFPIGEKQDIWVRPQCLCSAPRGLGAPRGPCAPCVTCALCSLCALCFLCALWSLCALCAPCTVCYVLPTGSVLPWLWTPHFFGLSFLCCHGYQRRWAEDRAVGRGGWNQPAFLFLSSHSAVPAHRSRAGVWSFSF